MASERKIIPLSRTEPFTRFIIVRKLETETIKGQVESSDYTFHSPIHTLTKKGEKQAVATALHIVKEIFRESPSMRKEGKKVEFECVEIRYIGHDSVSSLDAIFNEISNSHIPNLPLSVLNHQSTVDEVVALASNPETFADTKPQIIIASTDAYLDLIERILKIKTEDSLTEGVSLRPALGALTMFDVIQSKDKSKLRIHLHQLMAVAEPLKDEPSVCIWNNTL